MKRPRVELYTLCWDEADMLGFFFRHYEPWVDRFVVYDDGSTDGSREILASHPKVELRTFQRSDADSFCLSHQALQDEFWKESRGHADWVVITAIDEHLHVRGRSMADYLVEQSARGVTLLPALGFDMNHPTMPPDEGLLVERVTVGRPRIAFNKLSLFDPNAVEATGFGAGRHHAAPAGRLVLPARNEVMLWHYKHLGFERNAEREAIQETRLGSKDRALDLAEHYRWSRHKLRSFWDQMERESVDLSAPDFIPDRRCIGPLWWSERGDIERTRAGGTEPRPRSEPTVSVLIKSFNHARYIKQTIESVLSQSFEDFEIVVTDDASTDGTADVVRSFADPRIKLEVNARNLGISGAMNKTVARARGKYLAILNSDDWALPERLRRQVDFLDANPHVAVLAGLPLAVDERGEPTEPYSDFRTPLTLPDFSRHSWLRHLFVHGNCICAPTAMIRREIYGDVGSYDRRLTNLQDFDLWLRILLAGHAVHVLPEEMTAFRIREQKANASAPSAANVTRHAFEINRVMRRYQTLTETDFEAIFGDMTANSRGQPLARRIALMLLTHTEPSTRLAALQFFADTAADDDAFDRLRELTGDHDVFGADAKRQLYLAWEDADRLRAENATLHHRLQDTFGHRARKTIRGLWRGRNAPG